jgi:hypothetical protein
MWSEVGGGCNAAPSDMVSPIDGASSAGVAHDYSRADHKHSISSGAITSSHIQDGSITNADISTDANIDFSKLTGVQKRVSSSCSSGSSIRLINDDGTVVCETDDTGGVGTPSDSVTPIDGTSSAGSSSNYSRGDHKHSINNGAITSSHILDGTITGTDIQDGTIGNADINFNYAGSTSKGGAASDLVCTGCVSQSELNFNPITTENDPQVGTLSPNLWCASNAAGTTIECNENVDSICVNEGQPNSITSDMIVNGTIAFADIGQNGCGINQTIKWSGSSWGCSNDQTGAGTPSSTVASLDGTSSAGASSDYSRGDHKHAISTGAITSTHILDGTITAGDVSFNFAGSTSKGGAASDLVCTGCVSQSELSFSPGDITAVNAGTGLSGGGDTGNVTLVADINYLQRRVSSTCSSGSSIRVIKADGTVECENDDTGSVPVPLILTGSTSDPIISGGNASSGHGMYGWSLIGFGIQGKNTSSGNAGHIGGQDYAIYGRHYSSGNDGYIGSNNYGIYGRHNNSGNYGYIGSNSNGLMGYSSSGTGVDGESGSGTGVLGRSYNSYGIYGIGATGIYGEHISSGNFGYLGGLNHGVYGKTNLSGINKAGVRGDATTSSTNIGVLGYHSANGLGVWGYAETGTGIFASNNSNNDYAFQAYSPGGKAALFSGNVDITGKLTKGSGTFVQPHPADPSMEIAYAFFEGPEHAIFLRGTSKLVKGKAVIETPEYFRVVAGDKGITVQFTPRSSSSKGLAAVEVAKERILVKELMKGKGTYEFDYFITAKRAGFEKHEPIQPNTHFSADMKTKEEFERTYAKTDDMTILAIRNLLISNSILTKEGKLNMATVKKLGWTIKETDLAMDEK